MFTYEEWINLPHCPVKLLVVELATVPGCAQSHSSFKPLFYTHFFPENLGVVGCGQHSEVVCSLFSLASLSPSLSLLHPLSDRDWLHSSVLEQCFLPSSGGVQPRSESHQLLASCCLSYPPCVLGWVMLTLTPVNQCYYEKYDWCHLVRD